MQLFLYSIAIKLYVLLIYLVSPFNEKARRSLKGRKGFFKGVGTPHPNKFIWFHCASLGEFEQGRPLIERIKREHPDKKILLSFFSPSGYEIRKDYPLADEVIYLPFDSKNNVKKFFQVYDIEMAMFVKYDVWPFYLREILKNEIPVFLISAVFRQDHFFFKWYGRFQKKMMLKMNRIFVQDDYSKDLAVNNGFTNIELAGDVRLDRVLEIKKNIEPVPLVHDILSQQRCIVFGSVYRIDEPLMSEMIKNIPNDMKIVIAPHLVNKEEVEYFKNKFDHSICFANLQNYANEQIIIIDHIGSLNQLYQYAEMVYVGGGYGAGIHNILEPAVFNIPVFFGPKFKKFPEAQTLVKEKLAFTNVAPTELVKAMINRLQDSKSEDFENRSLRWFQQRAGSSSLIIREISKYF